jgi:phage FluMu protein Com
MEFKKKDMADDLFGKSQFDDREFLSKSMKLIRCLNCNKVLGEVEGKAKIKCKMAGCHCMNVIDTDAETQETDPLLIQIHVVNGDRKPKADEEYGTTDGHRGNKKKYRILEVVNEKNIVLFGQNDWLEIECKAVQINK